MLTLCHSVSETLLVLGFRDWDFIFCEFRIPGLVLLWYSERLMQNNVGHIHMLTLCHSLSERVLVLSSGFLLLWVQDPRSSSFMSFTEANANGVGHPRYADLVPLCIRGGPGPGIQSLGFHLLWVQEPQPSSFYEFHICLCKTVLDTLDMLTLCHSVSERALVLGFRAQDFFLYEFRTRGLVLFLS